MAPYRVYFVPLSKSPLIFYTLYGKFKYLVLLLLALPLMVFSQGFTLLPGQESQKINFRLVNNLIVIPVEVNGAELSFILDSGVSKPILFNLTDLDSIQLNQVSEITIRGLGDGEAIDALASDNNYFKLKKIRNYNQKVFVVLDKDINLSTSLGIPVHGIIGFDLFRNFVVEINYGKEFIRFHDPLEYHPPKGKKTETLPLTIENTKAYVEGAVLLENDEEVPVKLLVDTGSSDAIWLFQNPELGLGLPERSYDDFLGKGLSGDIFGKRTRVHKLRLGSFILENAKAAFPDMQTFSTVKNLGDRNGSLGAAVLKRFNIVFNYPARTITIKKNSYFGSPFQFNMSGIALQHNGVRYIAERITDSRGVVRDDKSTFGNVQILVGNQTRLSLVPEIVVSGIRSGSPAAEAGLREGDVILAVNGKRVYRYKLQEVLQMLNEKEGKRVKVLIERYNKDLLFTFVLKDAFNE